MDKTMLLELLEDHDVREKMCAIVAGQMPQALRFQSSSLNVTVVQPEGKSD